MSFLPLSHWIKQLTGEHAFVELVDRITARCQSPVWARVAARVPAMDAHQAGGYIRARAALVIHREIQIATSGRAPLSSEYRRRLFMAVCDRTVQGALSGVTPQRARRAA